jgi:GT2 family glycosyltransferase
LLLAIPQGLPVQVENKFTIGIATKNRWSDLKFTLEKICEFGWSHVPVLIVDDCSDDVCPFDVSEIIFSAKLIRFQESKGYIHRRNQLAKLITTPYYLSLDDDSYPVRGSIDEALSLLKDNHSIFCVGFPIFNPNEERFQVASVKGIPYQTRSFIGCAHILDIGKFKDLGGYREELVHQGEEMDIAARAFNMGFTCLHSPGLLIHHNMSLQGRSWDRMDFFGARNNMLWNDWYLPKSLKLVYQIRHILSRTILSLKVKRWGQLKGMREGLKHARILKKYRNEIPYKYFMTWQKLPNS